MGIAMTVTIQLKAIMMAETAVHLMKNQIVGIPFVQRVNVLSLQLQLPLLPLVTHII
jgi:hypothetical protein